MSCVDNVIDQGLVLAPKRNISSHPLLSTHTGHQAGVKAIILVISELFILFQLCQASFIIGTIVGGDRDASGLHGVSFRSSASFVVVVVVVGLLHVTE